MKLTNDIDYEDIYDNIDNYEYLYNHINKGELIMIHYIIKWSNGAKESIYGSNYINALSTNHITPEMEHNIIERKVVNKEIKL